MSQPIAIVGIACRFPGGSDGPAEFWSLLRDGRSAVRETPEDRWDLRRYHDPDPAKPNKLYARSGSYLDHDLAAFDAEFFGISPREAAALDPQQKLLLELAWEALEDAGIIPGTLRGGRVGVYIGAFTVDHLILQNRPSNWELIGPHTAQGSTLGMLANRISHVFDFLGPSITVDTACSSSLVALHYACQDLRAGASAIALCGGVSLMLAPDTMMAMCKGHFLAPDGRSKAFDASADGYGRGEGAGIVVLKPLAQAVVDGDDVYAVIRGSGINQDGHTGGISLPNAAAQFRLLEDVYCTIGVDPDYIDYVEAHGTGTQAGDRAETAALGKWFGRRQSQRPLIIGSVKTNIGHLEAAAGIAGVIKTAMMLRHGEIPPHLNVERLNPDIPFEELRLRVPTRLEPWPKTGSATRYAAVNGFGYGGTNVHVVLEGGYPSFVSAASEGSRPEILLLSACNPESLRVLAERYATGMDAPGGATLAEKCHASAVRRTHHERRLAVVAASKRDLAERLRLFVTVGRGDGIIVDQATNPRRLAFIYTGMGPQWWGMAHALYEGEPVFRVAIDEVEAIFVGLSGWSLRDQMLSGEASSRMSECLVAQPANFAFQVGLTALLRSWGVEFESIIGHSAGEIAALHAAGVYGLADATRIAYHRARLQQRMAGLGAMLAVGVGREALEPMLADRKGLCLAAANGPASSTVTGDRDAIMDFADFLSGDVFHRRLSGDIAYHSHHMDPLREELLEALADLCPQAPTRSVMSTVTGAPVGRHDRLHAAYWWSNVRQPVLFEAAVTLLIADGFNVFLEIGPHPVLAAALRECNGARQSITTVAAQHRNNPGCAGMLEALGSLYVVGVKIDWSRLYPSTPWHARLLPRYPWRRERLFTETQPSRNLRLGPSGARILPGQRLKDPAPTWEIEVTPGFFPYIADHVVGESVVMPAAAIVEACLGAGRESFGEAPLFLSDLRLGRMLVVDPARDRLLRVSHDPNTGRIELMSAPAIGRDRWTSHARGRLFRNAQQLREGVLDLDGIRTRCPEPIDADALYARLAEVGLHYGVTFRRIGRLWRGEREALVELVAAETPGGPFLLDPSLLDAALHGMIALAEPSQGARPIVPETIGSLRFFSSLRPGVAYARLELANSRDALENSDFVVGSIRLADADGKICLEIDDLRCRALPAATRDAAPVDCLYFLRWRKAPVQRLSNEISAPWWVLGEEASEAAGLAEPTFHRLAHVADVQKMLASATGRVEGVLWLVPREVTLPGLEVTADALALSQALLACNLVSSIVVVTRGAQHVLESDQSEGLAAAPVWGMIRVLRVEHPELTCRLVDLPWEPEPADWAHLAAACGPSDEEPEWGVRAGCRHVPRVLPLAGNELEVRRQEPLPHPHTAPVVVQPPEPGSGSVPILQRQFSRAPGPGEVALRIHAVAVDAVDLGRLRRWRPAGWLRPSPFGREAAGVVTAVGPDVRSPMPGDHVVVLAASGLMASEVIVRLPEAIIVPKRVGLPFADALTFRAQVIGHHVLEEQLRLQPGEWLLLVDPAGDSLEAIVACARDRGVRVLAATSGQERSAWLLSLGVVAISVPDGVEDLVRREAPKGLVDAVVCTAREDLAQRSINLLAEGGRMVRLLRAGDEELAGVPLELPPGRILATVCPDRLLATPGARRDHLVAGTLAAEPPTAFGSPVRLPLFAVGEAFHKAAKCDRIGRIGIEMDERPLRARPCLPVFVVRPAATYLVTGGFGGLGLRAAEWLVKQGAQHLVLIGRRGPSRGNAVAALAELRAAGATVRAEASDVSDATQFETLLADVRGSMPPIAGIFHLAAVLEDGMLATMKSASLERTLSAKALGAWNLHRLTTKDPLDAFVLFSSISAVVGNRGQSSYAAANAFLDALAQARHASGLPGLSVNLGPIGDAGMLARDATTAERLARLGLRPMPAGRALDALHLLLQLHDSPQAVVVDVDWDAWARQSDVTPLLREVASVGAAHASDATTVAEMTVLSAAERSQRLRELVAVELATVLGTTPERIDHKQSIADYGLDSLMALEFYLSLKRRFAVDYRAMRLMSGPAVEGVAEDLLALLGVAG